MRITFEIEGNNIAGHTLHPEDQIDLLKDAIADAFLVTSGEVAIIHYSSSVIGEPGKCPKCSKQSLIYKEGESDGVLESIPYTCSYCKFEGIEHFRGEFEGHTDKQNMQIGVPR